MLDINGLVWRLRQLNCPQDFVLCILLIYWTYAVWEEQYDYYEFFAGIGNLTKQARACGYKALRFDILDSVKREDRKSNFMDLNSASGLQWYPYFKLAVVISQHISP